MLQEAAFRGSEINMWICDKIGMAVRGNAQGFLVLILYAAGMSINHVVETALILSGISHHQFMRFCCFVNLTHTSSTLYARNQCLYAAPAIHQEYVRMCDSITDDVKSKEDVILCGDGGMDSPGFSATKATLVYGGRG